MSERMWSEHLDGWRAFLAERIRRTDDFGERVKLDRQLRTIERTRYGAALNPALVSEFIRPSNEDAEHVHLGTTFLDLNDSQRRAVASSLGDTPLTLIQGPPGTGKTQVIAEICLQLLDRDRNTRILVCSETHVAVNNLIGRVSELANDYRIVRIRDKDGDADIGEYSPTSIVNSHLNWLSHVCDNAEVIGIIAEELLGRGSTALLGTESSLEKALALSANIAGMTCNRVASYDFRDTTEMFDVAIIDEVCKATLPEILAPLLVARKAVLVGDPMQLPPVFCSEEQDVIDSIDGCNLREYMYIDELFSRNSHTVTLRTQYRMVDQIGELISKTFYGGALSNGRHVSRNDSLEWIDYTPTSEWPSHETGQLCQPSVYNEDECRIISEVLVDVLSTEEGDSRIAIISPYRAQVTLLRNRIGQAENVAIDTVDGFQGKECDVVIFSVARTSGPFRFVEDRRRLNVALSRARNKIIVVGCLDYCRDRKRSGLLSEIANSCAVLKYEW